MPRKSTPHGLMSVEHFLERLLEKDQSTRIELTRRLLPTDPAIHQYRFRRTSGPRRHWIALRPRVTEKLGFDIAWEELQAADLRIYPHAPETKFLKCRIPYTILGISKIDGLEIDDEYVFYTSVFKYLGPRAMLHVSIAGDGVSKPQKSGA